VRDSLRGDAVRDRDGREVDIVRGCEERFELGEVVLRQVGKDAAATVVDHHERCVVVVRAEQSVRVVEETEVADERDGRRIARGRRDAEHRRHEPVDAVRAAVRMHGDAVARRHAPFERAHWKTRRHREV
jgi:hypothetical protein